MTTRWPTSGWVSGSSRDTYHALAAAGYLDNTVFVVTLDEWGGFYDHVPPPRVTGDTDPATVDHTGDETTPTQGRLIPDYQQVGFRVPAIVVSNLAPARVVRHGPFEHTSTLKLIESTFGLRPLTARDTHAEDLGTVVDATPRRPVPAGAIPTNSQAPGPASAADPVCSATSVQSVSPAPVRTGRPRLPYAPVLNSGAGMVAFGREYRAAKPMSAGRRDQLTSQPETHQGPLPGQSEPSLDPGGDGHQVGSPLVVHARVRGGWAMPPQHVGQPRLE